jgi:hypothetical protein
MRVLLHQLRRPGVDQPKQQSERQRDRGDAKHLVERGCREIEQNYFSRNDQDRYQYDRARLQNSGS